MWHEFKILLHHNDPITYTLIVLAFLAFIFILERSFFLTLIYNINSKTFMSNLLKIVTAADYDRAMIFCKKTSKHGIPNIMEKSILAYVSDPSSFKGKLEEGALDFIPKVEVRIRLIATLANTILMIGLAGTAIGIWEIFHEGNLLEGTLKHEIVNGGLSRSLTSTIFALITTAIILFFHTLLKSSAIKIVDAVESSVVKITNLLAPTIAPTVPVMAATQPTASEEEEDSDDDDDEDGDDSDEADASTEEVGNVEDLIEDNTTGEETYDIKDEEEII